MKSVILKSDSRERHVKERNRDDFYLLLPFKTFCVVEENKVLAIFCKIYHSCCW